MENSRLNKEVTTLLIQIMSVVQMLMDVLRNSSTVKPIPLKSSLLGSISAWPVENNAIQIRGSNFYLIIGSGCKWAEFIGEGQLDSHYFFAGGKNDKNIVYEVARKIVLRKARKIRKLLGTLDPLEEKYIDFSYADECCFLH